MKNYFPIISALIFLLSSCSAYRYIYSASPANNPYFVEKGQSKIAAFYSTNGEDREMEKAHGYDIQGAYAITDNWAVTGGYFHRTEKQISYTTINSSDSTLVKYQRQMFDLGTGYIIPLNEKRTATFNIYGGFSLGGFDFTDENKEKVFHRFYESKMTRYYIQPSLNFMPNENVNLSFLLRPSFVNYKNIRTDYTPDELANFGLYILGNKTFHFMEVGLNAQLGISSLPWVKLDGTLSTSSQPRYFPSSLAVHSGNFSIGLSFDLSKMKIKGDN